MQNLQDIEEKIFFECKNILDSLAKIITKDELLQKQDLFYEISERIAFLKILEKNESSFAEDKKSIEYFTSNEHDYSSYNEIDTNEDLVEEEVLFNNELNEINPEKESEESLQDELNELPENTEKENHIHPLDDKIEEEASAEVYLEEVGLVSEEQPILDSENQAATITEREDEIMAEDGKKESEEEQLLSEKDDNWFDAKNGEEAHDKKFKLANIKGLKSVQSLFEDEEFQTIEPIKNSEAHVSTNYMEAEKQKREFRLDLNDKLTFTKMLFDGSQYELNETVARLNHFKTIEQAKEYLSDLYYERNWDKVDEYAQRLWVLVENKFL